MRQKYGLTPEEYVRLLDEQGGGCAICGTSEQQHKHRRLAVDHDHLTGVVRGLLCRNCNLAVGLMEDCPTQLRKAAAYLIEFQRQEEVAA